MILVTGASGEVGCAVLRALSKEGMKARAFIHRESNVEKVKKAGAAEVIIGDMNEVSDLKKAFIGVDAVYYICSAFNPREDEIGEKMIEAAKEQGNIYFVYHSVLHSVLQDMPHHKRKLHVEQMLVDSGLDYTIVQPAVFMQMLMPAVKSAGKGGLLFQKFYTSNDTRMNLVDMADFAEAVAVILSGREYVNGTFELGGGENYSLRDVEDAFAEAVGRPVKSAFISDEDFIKQTGQDSASYSSQALMTMFRHYNTHSFRGNSIVLSQILKREPHTLRQFLKAILFDEA